MEGKEKRPCYQGLNFEDFEAVSFCSINAETQRYRISAMGVFSQLADIFSQPAALANHCRQSLS